MRADLHTFDPLLGTVRLIEYNPGRVPAILYTRLNMHYRPAVELARLILRAFSYELARGEARSAAFLVDMNKIFEDFVYLALRERLDLGEKTFVHGSSQLHLDKKGVITVEPDLSWWEGGRCVFVGDVKYKHVEGVVNSDIYQLLAYTIAADLPGGLLVYAGGEREEVTHEVLHAGQRLEVHSLNLSGTSKTILEQLGTVAMKVQRLRVLAEGRRNAA